MRDQALRTLAHILILLAMMAYAFAALFLNFYENKGPAQSGITYWQLLATPRSPFGTVGAILTAFGGSVLIAVLCLRELAVRWPELSRFTVVVAVATWCSFVVGSSLRLAAFDLPLGMGYWIQTSCAVLAIAGATMLLITPHSRTRSDATDAD
jgi:hypothetical protein